MQSVKVASDQAADSEIKAGALTNYEAAEKAGASRDDAICVKECKAAEQALG
jgi:hypothetical protein